MRLIKVAAVALNQTPLDWQGNTPSFHLDDENLAPKTWCRFPILSGGFGVELAELRRLHKNKKL